MLPLEWMERARPRPGRLVVQRDEQEKTYGGVIIIPESARQKKPARGTVVSVGERVSSIYPGDRVLLAVGISKRVTFGENEVILHICRPGQVMLVLESDTVEEVVSTASFSPYWSEADAAAEEGISEEGVNIAE